MCDMYTAVYRDYSQPSLFYVVSSTCETAVNVYSVNTSKYLVLILIVVILVYRTQFLFWFLFFVVQAVFTRRRVFYARYIYSESRWTWDVA